MIPLRGRTLTEGAQVMPWPYLLTVVVVLTVLLLLAAAANRRP